MGSWDLFLYCCTAQSRANLWWMAEGMGACKGIRIGAAAIKRPCTSKQQAHVLRQENSSSYSLSMKLGLQVSRYLFSPVHSFMSVQSFLYRQWKNTMNTDGHLNFHRSTPLFNWNLSVICEEIVAELVRANYFVLSVVSQIWCLVFDLVAFETDPRGGVVGLWSLNVWISLMAM